MGIVLPLQTVMNLFLLFSVEEVDQLGYAFALHPPYQIFFFFLWFFFFFGLSLLQIGFVV